MQASQRTPLLLAAALALSVQALPARVHAAADDAIKSKLGQSKAPWAFACDTVTVFNKENRVHCRGHVVFSRDDIKITCDLFEAVRDDAGQIKRAVCVEHVVMQMADGRATAEKAEWLADNQTLVLTGSPYVVQKGNDMRGDVITYDLKNDRLTSKRVRATVVQQGATPPPAPKKK